MTNIWVSVQVLPLALVGPANSLWQSAPTAPGKITQSFLLDIDAAATVSELFRLIDRRYKENYLPTAQHGSFMIKKLQDEDGDDLATNFRVGDLPRNPKGKLIIRVVPAVVNRELSVPVASSLRPIDFERPSGFGRSKRRAGFSDDGPNKRLRHDDDVDYDAPATAYHPDQPIRSTERSLADFPLTSVDQSSPPPRLRPQSSYGDVIADSEDERRVTRSDDEPNEEEEEGEEEEERADEEACTHEKGHHSATPNTSVLRPLVKLVQPVRHGSSPEKNGQFKKPALPKSAVKETASTPVRKLPSPAVPRPTSEDQWRHAQPRISQPDQDDDPFEIPDTDNERGQKPTTERASDTVVSRQQSIQQLKNRRRSRGETSDLEQSPRPRSGDPERRTTKTYGSARSKNFSSAARLGFANSQSQPTAHETRPFTPDLNGFEELLAEPMPSREELARRRSREERNGNTANAEATRQYFQAASAGKAKKLATLSVNSDANQFHMRQPSLSTRPMTTPSDVAGDASPTPASRSIPHKDLPGRRTSSVSFVIPDDTTTSPQAHSPIQPPTVAGPSSETSNQKRITPFSTPAARMRQSIVGNLIKSHTPSAESSKKIEPQGSSKKAPACTRCKTLKMACSATKTGLYPCEKCVKASITTCAPPNGTRTPGPGPSSLRRSVPASSKIKGKAPERAPRAGTLENLRISRDQSTEAIDDSEYEDELTPVARRGTNTAGKANVSIRGTSTKQRATASVLEPLTNSSIKPGAVPPPSNGNSKAAMSTRNGDIPPTLAEAFRTPSADASPERTEKAAHVEPVSQEDESPGSEGDVESNVSDDAGFGKNKSQGLDKQSDEDSSTSSTGDDSDGTHSDDDDDETTSGSEEEEEENVASAKPVPTQKSAQKPAGVAKTQSPPQPIPLKAPESSKSNGTPQSRGLFNASMSKSAKVVSSEIKAAPAKFPTSSADAMTKLPSRRKPGDSDSDSSSSSSSSSSAGSTSSADDVAKTSRKLAAAQRRRAGQGTASSIAIAPASANGGTLGSVKNFISSTFGFSSSQHDSGGRDAWYNVPDSPEPGP